MFPEVWKMLQLENLNMRTSMERLSDLLSPENKKVGILLDKLNELAKLQGEDSAIGLRSVGYL